MSSLAVMHVARAEVDSLQDGSMRSWNEVRVGKDSYWAVAGLVNIFAEGKVVCHSCIGCQTDNWQVGPSGRFELASRNRGKSRR